MKKKRKKTISFHFIIDYWEDCRDKREGRFFDPVLSLYLKKNGS